MVFDDVVTTGAVAIIVRYGYTNAPEISRPIEVLASESELERTLMMMETLIEVADVEVAQGTNPRGEFVVTWRITLRQPPRLSQFTLDATVRGCQPFGLPERQLVFLLSFFPSFLRSSVPSLSFPSGFQC